MADRVINGYTRVWWLTTLSSTTSPTAAQITAGVDLTDFITADGLDIGVDQANVDTTSLNSVTETGMPGVAKADIKLTMKRKSTDTAWTTFASPPVAGWLVVRRGVAIATAATAAQKVEVYPCTAGNRMPVKPASNEVEKFEVNFPLSADYVVEATVA